MTDHSRDTPDTADLRQEARAFLLRLTSGVATEDDVAALERWRRRSPAAARAFAEAALLWEVSGEAVKIAAGRSAALGHIADAGTPRRSTPLLGRRAFVGGGAVAATALLVVAAVKPPLALWPSLSEFAADYRTARGERRTVAVTGSVSVEMNTETSIALKSGGEGTAAIELLAGEAVVAAERPAGLPFTVIAGNGSTTATRGAFDIRNDDGTVCVTCIRGEAVVRQGRDQVALKERGQATYGSRSLGSSGDGDPRVVTAWRQGLLIFENVPLVRVVEEVNRYRQGRIFVLDGRLGRREVVADFRLDRLDAVIEFAARVMNARVRTLPGGIVLLG